MLPRGDPLSQGQGRKLGHSTTLPESRFCSAYPYGMAPKVLHLSTYAANGGAARAASALHEAMLAQGSPSELWTARGKKFVAAQFLDRQLWRLQSSPIKTWRSPARFGSLTAKEINASDADVVNLHWVTDGFLSVEEIGRITKPIVWSLYDMWPLAGTEHYGADTAHPRWLTGYTAGNRSDEEGGIDIDRWTWRRKKRNWTTPMNIVSASSWLHNRATASALLGAWSHDRIPHIVDCDVFAPMPTDHARRLLGIDTTAPIVLFLASAGIGDQRKGWDLLEDALIPVRESHPDLEVVIVGPMDRAHIPRSRVKLRWYGIAKGNSELALLYNAANVTAVPSREDNSPLTAMEAQTCGTPVVAFEIGGLPDIVAHECSGYLAQPGDVSDLAKGLCAALEDDLTGSAWGIEGRRRALTLWSPQSVGSAYQGIYERMAGLP
jgi:glycosyltransferase involved in cell wall biosynthesis